MEKQLQLLLHLLASLQILINSCTVSIKLLMLYGINLKYLDNTNDSSLLYSGGDDSLVILEDNTIDHLKFPISLIYQNNQDRQISLTTNRDFTTPTDDQPWIFYVENVISFAWDTKGSVIRYRFHELATDDIFRFWLYHVVLPIYFSIAQKYRFLHAGAV
ncbi:MAG: hypothetical protein JHC35_08585, partial [Sulfuricurvum sp.]|nr:hypothetical protein [Sulfuricurvum sp.]